MKADTTLRQQFIRDFMIQTQRPVSELPAFLQAFDSCEVTTTCEDISKTIRRTIERLSQPTKEPQVVHGGTMPNKHPRAKMVMAEFEGRTDYYGSIAAAAERLGVTQAAMHYALKHKKPINGISVITVSPEEVFQMKKEEKQED